MLVFDAARANANNFEVLDPISGSAECPAAARNRALRPALPQVLTVVRVTALASILVFRAGI
jgi:hypothetical protein